MTSSVTSLSLVVGYDLGWLALFHGCGFFIFNVLESDLTVVEGLCSLGSHEWELVQGSHVVVLGPSGEQSSLHLSSLARLRHDIRL